MYSHTFLKADTHQSRETGIQIRCTPSTIIQRNHFHFLAAQLTDEQYERKTIIVCTLEDNGISSETKFDVTGISPLWHEEAGGHLLLHVKHTTDKGHDYNSNRLWIQMSLTWLYQSF